MLGFTFLERLDKCDMWASFPRSAKSTDEVSSVLVMYSYLNTHV